MNSYFVLALICLQVYYISCEEYIVPGNINIDEILKNDRLTRNYVDCVLGNIKCTSEGEQLKKAIPEILENNCAKCNDKQKQEGKKVLRHLIKNKPDWWKEVTDKYDPQGQYKVKYEEYLKTEGLTY